MCYISVRTEHQTDILFSTLHAQYESDFVFIKKLICGICTENVVVSETAGQHVKKEKSILNESRS